jgi:hypothetical protein
VTALSEPASARTASSPPAIASSEPVTAPTRPPDTPARPIPVTAAARGAATALPPASVQELSRPTSASGLGYGYPSTYGYGYPGYYAYGGYPGSYGVFGVSIGGRYAYAPGYSFGYTSAPLYNDASGYVTTVGSSPGCRCSP